MTIFFENWEEGWSNVWKDMWKLYQGELFEGFDTVTAPWVDDGGGAYSIDGTQIGDAPLTDDTVEVLESDTINSVVDASGLTGVVNVKGFDGVDRPIANGRNEFELPGTSKGAAFTINATAGAIVSIDKVRLSRSKIK